MVIVKWNFYFLFWILLCFVIGIYMLMGFSVYELYFKNEYIVYFFVRGRLFKVCRDDVEVD